MDDDLPRIEEALVLSVQVDDPFLSEVAGHLITAGGKRLRPVLTLAAAGIGGTFPASNAAIQGGIAAELVHLASLYHDDVMDEADTRRTVQSVNSRWGNLVAVVTGDFLLAKAAGIAASLGTPVASLLASTLGRMCEGQIAEMRAAFNTGRTEADYAAAISGKTASLVACACRIGALTAALPSSATEPLTSFGEAFGMVFQLRDDIMDVVADEAELGKEPGQDLANGIYTLPVLRALADPAVSRDLAGMLGGPLNPVQREAARGLVAASSGITSALAEARRYATIASDAAAALPSSPLSEALARLPHSILDTVSVPTH